MTPTETVVMTDVLEAAGVPFEVLEHVPTQTAAGEALALGLKPHEVAKTIVVTAPEGNARVLLPASERIDMHKLRELLGAGKDVHLLDEEELAAAYPEFELGAVPPIGGPPDPVVLDDRLASLPSLVLEAGRHDRSLRIGTAELRSLTKATVADVCRE
jgi:Ala-tRNA(Pro) deacylase